MLDFDSTCHLTRDSQVKLTEMTSLFRGSPYRRRLDDLEAKEAMNDGDVDGGDDNPFDISSTKMASIDRLRRWRVHKSLSLSLFLPLDCLHGDY